MTQVSKYPVSKEVYEQIFDIFLKSITTLNTTTLSANFLKEFLSPTEQIMLAKRLAIGFLLINGYDHRTISKTLRVSTGTISRVNHFMRNGRYYKMIIDRLLEDEKINNVLLKIGEFITGALSLGKSKSGTWVYLRGKIEKKKRSRVL